MANGEPLAGCATDMPTMPTAAEIQAAAERLTREGVPDLLGADGGVRHEKRAQVAKAIQMAATETSRQEHITHNATAFAKRVRAIQDALDAEGIRTDTTAAVLGAIAAPLWRGHEGESHT